jgi:UDP-N-acetylmuramoylalanine--D-glutamate ligase
LNLIVGLGKTGLSCARYLARKGEPFAVTDSRLDPPGLAELKKEFPHCEIALGAFSADLFTKAKRLIISPGVPLTEPLIIAAKARNIPIIGDIELFALEACAPIVAITGSNGKSTVTTLVGEMAKAAGLHVQVGGNLGTPALDLLQQDQICDLYVLELSSFQLETTHSLQVAAATVLNISPDHMDRYADLNAYVAAKQRIYAHCKTAILNQDDVLSFPEKNNKAQKNYFTIQAPQENQWGLREQNGQIYLAKGENNVLPISAMRMKGRHNWANALAALALGEAVQLPLPVMLETLKNFTGLEHRCQWVAEHENIAWYNDSKGTNVGATRAAIDGLGGALQGSKIILLAGGLGKDADFTSLQMPVREYVRTAILFGQDAAAIGTALAPVTTIIYVKDMAEAVQVAEQQAQSGDAVLLSPACASFDMFNNFEHRGQIFMALVKDLFHE